MRNDAMAIIGCIGAVGIVGLIGWLAGTYKWQPRRGWCLRRWLFISLALSAIAALAGCDPGQPGGRPAASGASTAASPATSTAASPATSATSTGITARCVTSAAKGTCGPYRYPAITYGQESDAKSPGPFGFLPFVGQNVWNPIPGWSQTLTTTDPGNWYATANMPTGNTSVVSFPNVGQQVSWVNNVAPRLSSYRSIYSSFSENMNMTSGTDAEAAYDIWLNDWNNEVMIQHDFSALRPRCSGIASTATFGGSGGVPVQNWNLCTYGSEIIWQLAGRNEQAGSVDILAMLTWLVRHGYLPQTTGMTAISYGFEICSTGGQPETFQVSRFSISVT
jgi:hypothetical protein